MATTPNAFAALQNKAFKNPIPTQPPQPEKIELPELEVTVRLVLDKNIIEIEFNRDPGIDISNLICRHNFIVLCPEVYSGEDSEQAREFCRQEFGADLEPYISNAKQEVIDITPEPQAEEPQDIYTTYKKQVDALVTALDLSPTDVFLKAIEHFYNHTIGEHTL